MSELSEMRLQKCEHVGPGFFCLLGVVPLSIGVVVECMLRTRIDLLLEGLSVCRHLLRYAIDPGVNALIELTIDRKNWRGDVLDSSRRRRTVPGHSGPDASSRQRSHPPRVASTHAPSSDTQAPTVNIR